MPNKGPGAEPSSKFIAALRRDVMRAGAARAVVACCGLTVTPLTASAAGVSWLPDADGSWTAPTNWSSNPALPGAGDDVTIDVAGDRLITLSNSDQSVRSLTLGERLNVSGGSLAIGTTAQISGTLTLDNYAVLKGGVIGGSPGAHLAVNYGVLDGVTLNTDMYVNAPGAYVEVRNGLELNGTITIADPGPPIYASYGIFYFGYAPTGAAAAPAGALTGTGTLVLGRDSSNVLYNMSTATGAAGTLTIGPGITIRGHTGVLTNGYAATGTIANYGTIAADVAGGRIQFGGTAVNYGTLKAANGGTLWVGQQGGGFTNRGSIVALVGSTVAVYGPWRNEAGATVTATDATLVLGAGTVPWVNDGTITATNSQVTLGGSFTMASLGTFNHPGSAIAVTGTYTGDLALDAQTGSWTLTGGTIRNGTYTAKDGAKLVLAGGYLEHVTISSPLDMGRVAVVGELVVNADLNLVNEFNPGQGSTVGFSNAPGAPAGILSGTGTVTLGGNGVSGYLETYSTNAVRIEPGITIVGKQGGVFVNGSATNRGTIRVASGGTLNVGSKNFVNEGTITAPAGGALWLGGAVTNAAGASISATGATLGIGHQTGGQVPWRNDGTIIATDSTVNLGGLFPQAAMGDFRLSGSSTVNLLGVVDGNLALGAATGSWTMRDNYSSTLSAIVRNGTYSASGGAKLLVSLGMLENVTVAPGAVVDVSVDKARLVVHNGLVLDGVLNVGSADGAKAGLIDFGIDVWPAGSLTGSGTVVLGPNAGNTIRNSSAIIGGSQVLTIGLGVTIRGASGQISGLPIVNQGLISADVSGGRIKLGLEFGNGTFRNEGTVSASAGALAMSGYLFINPGTVRIGPSGPGGVASPSSPLSELSARSFTNSGQFEIDHARVTTSSSNSKFLNSGTLRVTAGAIQLPAVGFTNTGTVDLRSGGGVVLRPTSTATTVAWVRNQLVAGYHGGAWDGLGIHSDSAAADSTTAVGYAVVGQAGTFMGVDLAVGDVLVRHTKNGDATLDGAVNFGDLLALARAYNTAGAQWYQGDFDYNGTVNFNDLLILARNYNSTMPAAGAIPGAPAAFDADLAAAFAEAAVPEPSGALVCVSVLGAVAMRRRRRLRSVR